MEPRTLSASAILKFLDCPAGYRASYIDRIEDTSGVFANLGTACHEAIETVMRIYGAVRPDLSEEADWSSSVDTDEFQAALEVAFTKSADRMGLPSKQKADGLVMLNQWINRCGPGTGFWERRRVLSMETKETFELKIGKGEEALTIPVTFIWDRCDLVTTPEGNPRIEIIDYKSYARPVPTDELSRNTQVRIYALAAALKFKEMFGVMPDIWVKLDLLRYDLIGVRFTRKDLIETLNWLRSVYRAILLDEGTDERLNPGCRWCVRRLACKTLRKAGEVMHVHSLDVDEAAVELRRVQAAKAALARSEEELEEVVMDWLEEHSLLEHTWDTGVKVRIGANSRRDVDSAMASRVVGEELVKKYGRIGVTQIEQMKKKNELTPEQVAELDRLISTNVTSRLVISTVEDDA